MSKRIFRSFALLILLAILLTFAAMEYISYQEALANTRTWAQEDARLIAAYINDHGVEAVNSEIASIIEGRVTVIAADGTVLFESGEDSSQMENHLERPEVQEALTDGEGAATRYSTTLGEQTYYYACRTDDGSVVRISRTMNTVMGEVVSRIGIAAALMALLMVWELFMAKSVTSRIVAPINSLDLEKPMESSEGKPVYEELRPLLERIDVQNKQIHRQMDQLSLDMAELSQAETIRREFTANVSHELKTPLMSISGYAELIENGIARQEDVPEFASRIHSEANRLKNLVDDIIRLTRMEEGGSEIKKEEVDLYEVCEEAVQALREYAKEQEVALSWTGQHVTVRGTRQILFEMVYNLCDNAIKYNQAGGWARLELDMIGGAGRVTVSDNGIGIAEEHQKRIFERFYRVDKSHSRATGGTGLGLSIVKHGAMLHDAKIQLESKVGHGTTICIIFPLNS